MHARGIQLVSRLGREGRGSVCVMMGGVGIVRVGIPARDDDLNSVSHTHKGVLTHTHFTTAAKSS
jgi:hypothetical protein